MAAKAVDPVRPDEPVECASTDPGELAGVERDGDEAEELIGGADGATGFIEIILRDEAGEPVPGERYRIELPDGRFVRGSLDEQGFARHEGLPDGTCRVSFVGLDQEAWE